MNRQELCQFLNVLLNRVQHEKNISTEVYATLITLFPTVIAPALEIIDHGKVTKVIC